MIDHGLAADDGGGDGQDEGGPEEDRRGGPVECVGHLLRVLAEEGGLAGVGEEHGRDEAEAEAELD